VRLNNNPNFICFTLTDLLELLVVLTPIPRFHLSVPRADILADAKNVEIVYHFHFFLVDLDWRGICNGTVYMAIERALIEF
jgi:hypothetical protein